MINRELTENELFAAAWLFYLDCPLTADDLNGLWQLPRYGSRKPRRTDAIGVEAIESDGVIRKIVPRGYTTAAYELAWENLSRSARWSVQSKADAISQYGAYSETTLETFLDEHVPFFEEHKWNLRNRLRFHRRRIEVCREGLRTLNLGHIVNRSYSFREDDDNPTGDGGTLLDVEDSFIARWVAWSERRYLQAGNSDFAAADQKELLKYVLAEGFRLCENVDWAYERLLRDLSPEELKEFGAIRLGAYAFWRGRSDWLDGLRNVPALMKGRARDFIAALAEGKVAEALEALVSEWQITKIRQSYFSYRDFPALVFALVAALTGERTLTVTKKVINILLCLDGRIQGGMTVGIERIFDTALLETLSCRSQGIKSYCSDPVIAFRSHYQPYESLLVAALVAKKGAAVLDGEPRNGVGPIQDQAERALGEGYATVAATLAATCKSVYDFGEDAKCATFLREAEKNGGRIVTGAPADNSSAWETALAAFEKAVKPAKGTGRRKRNHDGSRLFWVVDISEDYRGDWRAEAVGAAVSGKRAKDGEGVSLTTVSDKRLLAGEYDEILTERDRAVRSQLVKDGVLSSGFKRNCMTPKCEDLACLCGLDNLMCRELGGWTRTKDKAAEPLELRARESKIDLRTEADGSITLRVPDRATVDPRQFMLKKKQKGVFELHYCTERFAVLAGIVNRHSGGGRLRIPPEGVAKFERWIESSDSVLPFSAGGGKGGAGKSRKALNECVVRLRYAGGELSVRAAVRISRQPDVVVEPCAGLAERPVVDKKGGREVLVRDFAAERAAIAPVQEVMKPFGSAQPDARHWILDNAEEALDALSALKAASVSGAFSLEWPEGEGLRVSRLQAHTASISGGETADHWLSVTGEFTLDDGKVLSFIDLIRSFDSREGAYVKLSDDRYLKLSAVLARRVEALKGAGVERNGGLSISPAALPSLERAARETGADDELPLPEIVRSRIDRIRDVFAAGVALPAGLKCQMRPYQVEGYELLARLADCGIGACLADDMGLGKTVQLIALLLRRRKDGPSLVVAPASVVFNWRDEIARFAPTLTCAVVGQNPAAADEDVAKIAKSHDVVVTSYGVLSSREDKFAFLAWNAVVLDEAQAIKNHLTKRSKTVKTLKAKFRVVATGTPIENRLSELWSIFDFINPGMLGGESRFARELAPHGEASPRLKRLVKPLILRRLKRDVLTDLPEKEEITVPVVMGEEERHAYEATRQNAVAKLESGDRQNKIAILAELTRLRRFCCHPSLVMPAVQVSAKLERLCELLEGLRANNHRALVFSQFVDCLAIVRRALDERGWTYKYLDGATPKAEREREVAAFQSGEGDFFLISLKAGGMGLNLTAANYVVLLDPWWNPAVENQAADRVHRIGQHLPVTVYRLICKDTIEEKVVNLHAKKAALSEDVLSGGASSLSAEAMFDLLSQA